MVMPDLSFSINQLIRDYSFSHFGKSEVVGLLIAKESVCSFEFISNSFH
jgi:hypothetical protein